LYSLLLAVLIFFVGSASAGNDKPAPHEPPTVVSHTPAVNEIQAPINGVVSVVWDRPMQPDTNFTVTGPEGFIPGAFWYDSSSYTVTFLPAYDFMPDTRYGVLVAGQIDINGQVQQAPYQWNFDTVAPPSVTIITFGTDNQSAWQNWWWSSWPWLMAAISIFSLIGFLIIWNHRRLKALSDS
jgi:hypothetical protein